MTARLRISTFVVLAAAVLLTTVPVDRADAQTLISFWTLNGNIDSSVPQTAILHDPNVTVSTLASTGLVTGVHLNAFMADGWPSGPFDPSAYFEYTVTPNANFEVTYISMQFSLYNDSAGTSTWDVRSSVDGFANTIASGTTSVLTGAGALIQAFLPGVGTQTVPVTFRVYTHTNSGAANPQQRGLRGSAAGGTGLRINGSVTASPLPFVVSGRFLYEDRMWDKDGHTGAVQNLPIRHADVEIVDANGDVVVSEGSTDVNGDFAIETALTGTVDLYARVLTNTENNSTYQLVVNGGANSINNPLFIHAVPTDVVLGHAAGTPLDLGTYLIADTDGTGVAQAFNILDRAIDGTDWLAQPEARGSYPGLGVSFRWGPVESQSGSFYVSSGGRVITIASPGSGDTDGWSDAVILHEFGHYVIDISHQDDSPGGPHFLGDNLQNPLLSYAEGYATYFCAEAREFTAFTAGTDDHVTIYADMDIPPPVGTPGGLGFGYDFETGTFSDGTPISQLGQANESNVTSAMWDLTDGPSTPDESPGVDDDSLDGDGTDVWAVLSGYMATLPFEESISFEDFVQGWKSIHGPTYFSAELDEILNDINSMGFEPDIHEPDDEIAAVATIVVGSFDLVGPSGGVVINEINVSSTDGVELYNSSDVTVDIGLYQVVCTADTWPTTTYTFAPSFPLAPGSRVYIHERSDPANDSANDVYLPENIYFDYEQPGACALLDDAGVAIDFVRFDGVGNPTATPVPPGTVFTGSLASPPVSRVLGRDSMGTDTDDASDFTVQNPSGGVPNLMPVQARTFFDTGDVDEVGVPMLGGKTYVLRTLDLFGGGNSNMVLLDTDKFTVLDTNDDRAPGVLESMITYTAPQTGLYYARLTHVGTLTDYGMYNLLVYALPQSPTAINDPELPAPRVTELRGTYPNPFNPRLTVAFELDRERPVSIKAYDARGRLVRHVLEEARPPGDHTVVWDGKDDSGLEVAGGVYFLRFESEDVKRTTKVTLVK